MNRGPPLNCGPARSRRSDSRKDSRRLWRTLRRPPRSNRRRTRSPPRRPRTRCPANTTPNRTRLSFSRCSRPDERLRELSRRGSVRSASPAYTKQANPRGTKQNLVAALAQIDRNRPARPVCYFRWPSSPTGKRRNRGRFRTASRRPTATSKRGRSAVTLSAGDPPLDSAVATKSPTVEIVPGHGGGTTPAEPDKFPIGEPVSRNRRSRRPPTLRPGRVQHERPSERTAGDGAPAKKE